MPGPAYLGRRCIWELTRKSKGWFSRTSLRSEELWALTRKNKAKSQTPKPYGVTLGGSLEDGCTPRFRLARSLVYPNLNDMDLRLAGDVRGRLGWWQFFVTYGCMARSQGGKNGRAGHFSSAYELRRKTRYISFAGVPGASASPALCWGLEPLCVTYS